MIKKDLLVCFCIMICALLLNCFIHETLHKSEFSNITQICYVGQSDDALGWIEGDKGTEMKGLVFNGKVIIESGEFYTYSISILSGLIFAYILISLYFKWEYNM